ncbi:MAG TPA: helix-turn-helix domain-containing protein [Candidatus Fimicola cottocaccae]|nr:helix-turn-helix domain-containing protein [Candidatus Fimicola cottocaccae]
MATTTKLVVSTEKVQIKMAELCMNPYDLCIKASISYYAYQRILKTGSCKLATLGKIAKALNSNITEIVKEIEL